MSTLTSLSPPTEGPAPIPPGIDPNGSALPTSAAAQDGVDEALIADARAALTPAEMVERKLLCVLKGGSLPVSHVRLPGLPPRGRARG